MIEGAFTVMKHEHIFEANDQYTLMIDVFRFKSPLGILGKMVNQLFLTSYMRKLLVHRNAIIKEEAERLANPQHQTRM